MDNTGTVNVTGFGSHRWRHEPRPYYRSAALLTCGALVDPVKLGICTGVRLDLHCRDVSGYNFSFTVQPIRALVMGTMN